MEPRVDVVGGAVSLKIALLSQYEPFEVKAWSEYHIPTGCSDEVRKETWQKVWGEITGQMVEQLQQATSLKSIVKGVRHGSNNA